MELMFRPLHSLDPPGCSHRRKFFLGGRAVYTAQNPVGCLPQAAASLHARHGQLAWLVSPAGMQPCRLLPHPLDDIRSSMVASQPPFPFDQPCLVASILLTRSATRRAGSI